MTSFLNDLLLYLPTLLDGLKVSVVLTLVSLAIGLPCALLLALGSSAQIQLLRGLCILLVEVGRGAPALVLLQMAYYGLAGVGLTLTSFAASAAALSWTTAAYCAEFVRAGLGAVPAGEKEATAALGMSKSDSLRFVVIPQGLRIALPSLMGFAVMLFQATSLAYSIALPELMSKAYSIGSSSFRYLNILLAAGVLYAAISIPSTWLSVYAERRMNRHLA